MTCGQGRVLQEQNTVRQVLRFIGIATSIHVHNMYTIYCAALLKIINYDQPLNIPKDWGCHLPCWMNRPKFLRRGWDRVFPLFVLHFWLWVKDVIPCLILGYYSLDKTPGIIFIARQEIPRNIEPSPFLIINQHSRHPTCQNIWQTEDVS